MITQESILSEMREVKRLIDIAKIAHPCSNPLANVETCFVGLEARILKTFELVDDEEAACDPATCEHLHSVSFGPFQRECVECRHVWTPEPFESVPYAEERAVETRQILGGKN